MRACTCELWTESEAGRQQLGTGTEIQKCLTQPLCWVTCPSAQAQCSVLLMVVGSLLCLAALQEVTAARRKVYFHMPRSHKTLQNHADAATWANTAVRPAGARCWLNKEKGKRPSPALSSPGTAQPCRHVDTLPPMLSSAVPL